MALPSSFIAGQTIADVLDASALSVNFNAGGGPTAPGTEFFRASLWMNGGETGSPSVTPHSTTAPYGTEPWANSGSNYYDQWDDSGYTAGGGTYGTLTNPTLASTATGLTWSDGFPSLTWSGLSDNASAGVYGTLITHYISSAANRPVCFLSFGAAFPSSSTTFTITWSPSGIWRLNY